MVELPPSIHCITCKACYIRLLSTFVQWWKQNVCFIKTNQAHLWSENYIHLRDRLNNDVSPENFGKTCILLSSYTGSPQYMHKRAQDTMAYVWHFCWLDLFITFTCNPKWPEIIDEVLHGQCVADRHDLLVWVFQLKLEKLVGGLIFKGVKCSVTWLAYTKYVGWQKREYPHAHLLFWLLAKIKATDIDKIISAELPNPDIDKELYDIVAVHMWYQFNFTLPQR